VSSYGLKEQVPQTISERKRGSMPISDDASFNISKMSQLTSKSLSNNIDDDSMHIDDDTTQQSFEPFPHPHDPISTSLCEDNFVIFSLSNTYILGSIPPHALNINRSDVDSDSPTRL
jgi:hypothetical protein